MAGEFEKLRLDKHRRNLMGISAILLFVTFAGIRFDELNILGTKIDIKNPSIVTICLWVLFFFWWSGYRLYCGYFLDSKVFVNYSNELRNLLIDRAKHEYMAALSDGEKKTCDSFEPEYVELGKPPLVVWPFFKRNVVVKYSYRPGIPGNVGHQRKEISFNLVTNKKAELVEWLKALKNTITKTPVLVDYIVPQYFAWFTLITCIGFDLLKKVVSYL